MCLLVSRSESSPSHFHILRRIVNCFWSLCLKYLAVCLHTSSSVILPSATSFYCQHNSCLLSFLPSRLQPLPKELKESLSILFHEPESNCSYWWEAQAWKSSLGLPQTHRQPPHPSESSLCFSRGNCVLIARISALFILLSCSIFQPILWV